MRHIRRFNGNFKNIKFEEQIRAELIEKIEQKFVHFWNSTYQFLNDNTIRIFPRIKSTSGPIQFDNNYQFDVKYNGEGFEIISATKHDGTFYPGDSFIVVENDVPDDFLDCDKGKSYIISNFEWDRGRLVINVGRGKDKWCTHFYNKTSEDGYNWNISEIKKT